MLFWRKSRPEGYNPNNSMYNPEIIAKAVRNRIKARKCPNGEELSLIPIVKQYGFEYTGDGRVIIGNMNPDFTNKEKKCVIEFAGDYWHPREYEIIRTLKFEKEGWKCLVIWESEIELAVQKIENWIIMK